MRGGEFVSAAIQLLVAVYLIFFYPRGVRRQFRNRPVPPLFRKLAVAAPLVGYLLAAGTVIYVVLRLGSVVGP